jgi:hypothetical protein
VEAQGRVGAASTTTGRAGTARRLGPGKRDGEVYECRNQWWNPLKRCAGSNLVDMGRYCSASVASWSEGTDSGVDAGKVGPEGTVNACGVAVAWAAGEKLGADPVERFMVNVGTVVESPSCRSSWPAMARHAVC